MAKGFDQHVARPIVSYFPRWIHPNHLSTLRAILVIPVIYWRDRPWIAVSLLIVSSLCDLFDGPLARLRGQQSQLGAVLDATSDKIFVLGTLLFACGDRVPLWIRIAVVAIDVMLTAIRPIKLKLRVTTNSNAWGGCKTWTQSFALAFVLTRNPLLAALAPWTFYAAIVCALLSLRGHLDDLRKRDIKN